MEAFAIVAMWFSSLAGGSLLTIGLITSVRGQAVINVQHMNWSVREARILGFCWTIQGAAVGPYALYGGLSLGAHVIPVWGVGSPWGLFATAPLALIMMGTLFVQAAVQLRHENRVRRGA